MPPLITSDVYISVNSIVLATPAYRVVGYSPLLDDAPPRGENTVIPHVDGRLANPLHLDEWPLAFNMIVDGRYLNDGTAYADPRMGLITNREYLNANIGVRQSVPLAWRRFNGTTRSATCQVVGFTGFSVKTHLARTVLNLIVPAGVLGAPV